MKCGNEGGNIFGVHPLGWLPLLGCFALLCAGALVALDVLLLELLRHLWVDRGYKDRLEKRLFGASSLLQFVRDL